MDILYNREDFNLKRFVLIFLLVFILILNNFITNYLRVEAFALEIASASALIYYAKALLVAGLLTGALYYGTSPRPLKDGEVFEIPNSVDKKVQGKVIDLQKYLDSKQKTAISFVSNPDPNKQPPKDFNDIEKGVLNKIKETGKLTWEFFKTFGLVAFISSILNLYSEELFIEETIKNDEYSSLISLYRNDIYEKPTTIQDVKIINNKVYIYFTNGNFSSFPISETDDVIRFYTDNFNKDVGITTMPVISTYFAGGISSTERGLMQFYRFNYPQRDDGSRLVVNINVPLYASKEDETIFPKTDRFHSSFWNTETVAYTSTYTHDTMAFEHNGSSGLSSSRPPASVLTIDRDGNIISKEFIRWGSASTRYEYYYSFLKLFEKIRPIYEEFYGEGFNIDLTAFREDYGISKSGFDRKFFNLQFGLIYNNVPSWKLNNNVKEVIKEYYPINHKNIKEDSKQLPVPIVPTETIQDIAQKAEQEYNTTGDISPPVFLKDTVELEDDVSIDLDLNSEGLITVDNVEPIGEILENIDSEITTDSTTKPITESSLLEVLKSATIPREGYFQDFYTSISSAFESKIPMLGTLKDFFTTLLGLNFDEFGPPSFTITVPKEWGGGTYNVIDFSYFTEYRTLILNLIRFPAWFFFLKRLYGRIANIVY
ncbi:hypothetical protein [Tissierella sp.]|uniref:hypothetical protein n=1 Tax=Tissierella sp. TaxID=41274 RepID=UPI00306F2059